MNLRGFFALGALVGTMAVGSQASAAILTFNFDTYLTGQTPNGSNIATMTIADSGTDTVLVTLSHNATSAAGQFITTVWFNLNPFVTPTQTNRTPINKFDGSLQAGLNGQQNAGYNFDLRQDFQTSNSGGGANRLKPGESVSFNLSAAGLDAMDFASTAVPNGSGRNDVLAMIHLQGIDGGGSVKLGAVVPEPATMAVLGLGVVPFLRRRRR